MKLHNSPQKTEADRKLIAMLSDAKQRGENLGIREGCKDSLTNKHSPKPKRP